MNKNIQAGGTQPFDTAPLTWEQIARNLFNLLDDCDTADDIAKSDDAMFRSLVRKAHKERFKYGQTDGYEVEFNVNPSPPIGLRDQQHEDRKRT